MHRSDYYQYGVIPCYIYLCAEKRDRQAAAVDGVDLRNKQCCLLTGKIDCVSALRDHVSGRFICFLLPDTNSFLANYIYIYLVYIMKGGGFEVGALRGEGCTNRARSESEISISTSIYVYIYMNNHPEKSMDIVPNQPNVIVSSVSWLCSL